ncbi:MAG: cytidylate kinase-like family protein [Bacteroidales bacterium]|nr:cytidylate kinase-like family protein [Bacteroidales bacterium]
MSNRIITIGRQVGSGGRLIGRIVADRLGLAFYDREILSRAAQESGIRDEFFETNDEKNTFVHRLTSYFTMSAATSVGNSCLASENLFKYQSDAIRKAAEEGGSVFVGRCSDYILRDFDNRTDIFITADLDDRIARASEYFKISADEARKRIASLEKARAEYYNLFTSKRWGVASSYHLCINSSRMSLDDCASMIIDYIEKTGR